MATWMIDYTLAKKLTMIIWVGAIVFGVLFLVISTVTNSSDNLKFAWIPFIIFGITFTCWTFISIVDQNARLKQIEGK